MYFVKKSNTVREKLGTQASGLQPPGDAQKTVATAFSGMKGESYTKGLLSKNQRSEFTLAEKNKNNSKLSIVNCQLSIERSLV